MGIKSYIKNKVEKMFSASIETAVQERLPAAVSSQISMIGWRKLTGAPTRELPMMDYSRAIEVAYWLWKTNPMGKWIIEVITAFVTAKGTPYTCKNEKVKKILDDFWFDPVNRFDLHWENFVRELGIYGNQLWPVFVSDNAGRVRLGYIDPAYISTVYPDPENVKIKIGVEVSSIDSSAKLRRLKIVLGEENATFLSPAGQELRDSFVDGECFFFTINALTNEMLGTSDLFTIADHLDGYEQFLYDSSEKYARFNDFFYDVTVTGADEEKLEEHRTRYTPPKRGGAFIHNENVKSEAVAPDLKAADAQEAARLHRNHILGSIGLPEHWFGGGGDVNRATAAEMDAPAQKIIESRQTRVKNMLELMIDYVIEKAAEHGMLNGVLEEELFDYEVQSPDTNEKDVAKLSTMLTQVASSLSIAEVNGWISTEEAAKAFAYFLAFVGYEYTPDAEDAVGYEDYKKKAQGTGLKAQGEDLTAKNAKDTNDKKA
jgi:hypothetical protein